MIPVGADSVWVEDTGGEGTPLVLLHPGITDSRVWDRLLPLLAGHRVIRHDRRGFGRSPRATEEFRPLDDLIAVLDHLGVARAHLVGNSMGAELALSVALSSPSRVASLTLLCPGVTGYPWPDPTPAQLAEMTQYRELFRAGDVAGLAAMARADWCRSGSDGYLDEQLEATTRTDLEQGELEQPGPDLWEQVPGLGVPTTVVAGDLDLPDSLDLSLALADRVPGAVLVRTPADHLPQYRVPETVARAILATLARS